MEKIFLILILIFVFLFGVILLYKVNSIKKKEFNSIKEGDEIFYPKDDYYCECYDRLNSDIIISVEYYPNSNDVKTVHTGRGKVYTFIDYFRDKFILAKVN